MQEGSVQSRHAKSKPQAARARALAYTRALDRTIRQEQELAELWAFLAPEYAPTRISDGSLSHPSEEIRVWLSGDPEALYRHYLNPYGATPEEARARVE